MIIIGELEDILGNLLNFGVHGTAVFFQTEKLTDGISWISRNNNTKGHCWKVQAQYRTTRCRLDLRKNFFSQKSQRVVNHWNELPVSVVNASIVSTSKNRLDREWGNRSSH